jgi:hypothetical protein
VPLRSRRSAFPWRTLNAASSKDGNLSMICKAFFLLSRDGHSRLRHVWFPSPASAKRANFCPTRQISPRNRTRTRPVQGMPNYDPDLIATAGPFQPPSHGPRRSTTNIGVSNESPGLSKT